MNAEKHNSRASAARIIAQCLEKGVFLDRLIPADLPDRSFVMEVAYGVIRHRSELEWLTNALSSKRPDAVILPYLMTGLYQVFMMDDVEDYALVNETVDAVRDAGMKGLTGYVNGVLRNALRKKDALLERLSKQDEAVKYSHPELLVRRWTSQHGKDTTASLCEWNNSRPLITIRPRVSGYADQLLAAGITASPNPLMPNECFDLAHGTRIMDMPGYNDGVFMVQDASTLVPVTLLDPQPGETILDACAAPGGKTIHLADKLKGNGSVIAMDVSKHRLAAVEANLHRTGTECVTTEKGNATDRKALEGRDFDAVLIDAPCTNTGVLRRRPEAKWRFSEGSLAEASNTQRNLLDSCSTGVKPGGRLVFSTCSIEPEEGTTLVERWINSHRDFALEREEYLLPPSHGADGGYSALLVRKS